MKISKLLNGLVASVVMLSAVGTARAQSSTTRSPANLPIPAGLPAHFGWGLLAGKDQTGAWGIDGWMPQSGIPWDYASLYISNNWQNWAPNGTFPITYAQDAAAHHYIVDYTYYLLLGIDNSCSTCSSSQRYLTHLNSTSDMAAYWSDFRTLMQRLGPGTYNSVTGFGQPVVVDVNVDLASAAEQAVMNNSHCYNFCTAQGNNPAYLNAAVASSGDPDVQSFPNTYQGFNWGMLHIRDLYAPNVILALHFSERDSGYYVSSNANCGTPFTTAGQLTGSFAAQSGITGLPSGVHPYNVLFDDVLDRDSAYYIQALNFPHSFWDRLNVTCPNFHTWETFMTAVTQTAGLSAMVWQVPEGNQYFDVENNTPYHWQDNRAEYFFGHVGELASAGVIGVIFGKGQYDQTTHFDADKDGVTNPPTLCTTLGVSSGTICNNHTTTSTDDDGGYIRMEGQQYYASGVYPL